MCWVYLVAIHLKKTIEDHHVSLSMQFISMMVGRMRIGSQETRVAAVTFSNYAQIRIPLNQYNSLEPLQTAILDLPYSGGRTNTTGALRLARTEVFTEANGDRPNVKNIIVLITDGNTTVEASKLSDEVQRVKDADITVFGKCSPHHVSVRQGNVSPQVITRRGTLVEPVLGF